jgi:glycosyltransferase involved in cell wall biosynthesis
MGIGGAQDNTLLTTEGLSRNRFEVHLAAGEDQIDWEARAKSSCDAFFSIPALRRPIQPFTDLKALFHLKDLIEANHYHIVHTHSSKAGMLGRIAARLAGTPVVVHTIHGFPWHDYMSDFKKDAYILNERLVASFCDALITVSRLNQSEAVELGIAPAEKFTTIYSGINLEAFQVDIDRNAKCSSLNLDPSRPIVGTVGRLSQQKAPLHFVRAAKAVLAKRPDAQFVVVGDGPLNEEVRDVTDEEDRIRLLGFRDDVPHILSILDVFALSSRWEGLGRAVTEAMIMGLPVAVTAVNGVPEIVDHQETGLLSPPESPSKLAENILWLLNHPDQARLMGRRARKRVVPAFSAERMVAQIEALYDRLLVEKEIVDNVQR